MKLYNNRIVFGLEGSFIDGGASSSDKAEPLRVLVAPCGKCIVEQTSFALMSALPPKAGTKQRGSMRDQNPRSRLAGRTQ